MLHTCRRCSLFYFLSENPSIFFPGFRPEARYLKDFLALYFKWYPMFSGVPFLRPLSNRATVNVTVLDANAYAPAFAQPAFAAIASGDRHGPGSLRWGRPTGGSWWRAPSTAR